MTEHEFTPPCRTQDSLPPSVDTFYDPTKVTAQPCAQYQLDFARRFGRVENAIENLQNSNISERIVKLEGQVTALQTELQDKKDSRRFTWSTAIAVLCLLATLGGLWFNWKSYNQTTKTVLPSVQSGKIEQSQTKET